MSKVTFKDGKHVNYYDPPQKKKKMWWRYLLMWFTGVLSAVLIIGLTGVIFGTAFSSGEVLRMFGADADSILQPEYQNLSILKLATSLPNLNYETLGDIDKVTPIVKNTLLNDINPALEKEVYYGFDWDEIKTKPFKLNSSSPRPDEEYDHNMSLIQYIPHALKTGIKIGNFFRKGGVIEATGILKYVVYPIKYDEQTKKYYVDDTVGEDELVSLQDLISGGNDFFEKVKKAIVIGDVIDTSTSPFLQQVAGWTLAEFNDEKIKTLEIGSLISGGGPFIEQIRTLGWTIGDLNDQNIKSLEIGKLFSDEEIKNNILLQTIKEKEWTISDLTDFKNITALKLNQVLDTSQATDFIKEIGEYSFDQIMEKGFVEGLELRKIFPNAQGVLGALANKTYEDEQHEVHYYTVGDLNKNNRILALTVSEIFTGLKDGDLLFAFKDKTLQEISETDLNGVKIKDIFPNYISNSVLNAVVNLYGADNATIGHLTSQDTINNIPLSAVVPVGDNIVLKALVSLDATIGNLSSKINLLTLKDVIDVGTDTNSMIYKVAHSEALENCPITSIANNFSALKISDLFNVNGENVPQVLKSLASKGSTLASLSTDMNNLEIRDVMSIYPGDIYKRNIGDDKFEYYILHNEDWELIPNEELSDELSAYYTEKTGYLAKGEAQEFIGSAVPSKSDESLKDAKPRDSLYAVGGTKINNSAAMITALKNSLSLKDVVDIDDNSPQVLKSLKYTKLVDIPSKIASLKLSDIIKIDSTSSNIMNILAGVTVFGEGNDNLQHALENLNIIDLFGSDMYETGEKAEARNSIKISFSPLESDIKEGKVDITSPAYILGNSIVLNSGRETTNAFIYDNNNNNYYFNYVYSASSYSVSAIDTSIKEAYQYVTGNPYSGSDTFDENHNALTVKTGDYELKIEAIKRQKIKMVYWFMFSESDEVFSDDDKLFVLKKGYTYTVNSMSHFTDNMVDHIKQENLKSLYDAGLVTTELDFDAVLKSNIYGVTNPYGGRTVGSLSINELIDLINMLLPLITTPTT